MTPERVQLKSRVRRRPLNCRPEPPYSLNALDAAPRSQWRSMRAKRNWRGLAATQRNARGNAEGGYVTRASDHRPEVIILILAILALAAENRPFHGPLPRQHTVSRIIVMKRQLCETGRSFQTPSLVFGTEERPFTFFEGFNRYGVLIYEGRRAHSQKNK